MHALMVIFCIIGFLTCAAALAVLASALRQLRSGKKALQDARAGYNGAAGRRSAGEAAAPSPYTIPGTTEELHP
jgi:hypothetical protein